MLLTLLLLASGLVLMLKWGSDGHVRITRRGLDTALGRLTEQRMRSLGVSKKMLKKMMSWLALYNTAEDVEWCNLSSVAAGPVESLASKLPNVQDPHRFSCRVALGGDQVTHFMQSFDIPSSPSYDRSIRQIRKYTIQAWYYLNEAFKGQEGFLKTLKTGIMEFQNRSLFSEVVGGALQNKIEHGSANVGKGLVVLSWMARGIKDNLTPGGLLDSLGNDFKKGTHQLGRALHTVQDSFGPAHAMRDPRDSRIIRYLYKYDHDNHEPAAEGNTPYTQRSDTIPNHEGWPGHVCYDQWNFSPWTRYLINQAEAATVDWILCVLENIGKVRQTFFSAYSGIEGKWLTAQLVDDTHLPGYELAAGLPPHNNL